MKTLLQPVAVGLGITTICLLWVVSPLVDPLHNAIYHWSGSASAIFLPTVIDFCAFWLFLALLLLFAQRHKHLQIYLWTSIALFFPWFAARDTLLIYYGVALPHRASLLLLASPLVALVLLLTWGRRPLEASFEQLQRLMATVFCFLAILGLLLLCQLFWFARQARGFNNTFTAGPLRRTATAGPERTRIVWILLDELSYQQVYEQRFPGLKLAAFDQLADQATVFTHVVPTGISTEIVLPALMAGHLIDQTRSSASGQLSVHTPSGTWEVFNQHQTIFQDALNAGYGTGIAGWYNPYCRILPNVLDHCFWAFNQAALSHMSPDFSLRENLMAPFRTVAHDAGRLHIEDFRKLSQASDAVLQDRPLDFILLHLPVPHPQGIYNRSTGTFATEHASYVDNLALADRYLAHVREVLERNGEWDDSAIIVMGDHSWRTQLVWSKSGGWTPEDQLASHGGQFDDRPAYILKLPHQRQPARINSSFEALKTRQLLDAIMENKISSVESLSAWANDHPVASLCP